MADACPPLITKDEFDRYIRILQHWFPQDDSFWEQFSSLASFDAFQTDLGTLSRPCSLTRQVGGNPHLSNVLAAILCLMLAVAAMNGIAFAYMLIDKMLLCQTYTDYAKSTLLHIMTGTDQCSTNTQIAEHVKGVLRKGVTATTIATLKMNWNKLVEICQAAVEKQARTRRPNAAQTQPPSSRTPNAQTQSGGRKPVKKRAPAKSKKGT